MYPEAVADTVLYAREKMFPLPLPFAFAVAS